MNREIKIGTGSITLPSNVAIGSLIALGIVAASAVGAADLNFSCPRCSGGFVWKNGNATGPNRAAIWVGEVDSAGVATISLAEGNLAWGLIGAVELPNGVPTTVDDSDVVYTGVATSATSITTVGPNRVIITVQGGWHNACVFTDNSASADFWQVNGSDAICMGAINAPIAGVYAPQITMTGADENPMVSAAFIADLVPIEGSQFSQLVEEDVIVGISNIQVSQFIEEIVCSVATGGGGGPVRRKPQFSPQVI